MKIITALTLAFAIAFFSFAGVSQAAKEKGGDENKFGKIFSDGVLGGTVTAVRSADTIEIDGTAVRLASVKAPNRFWIGATPGCYSGEAKKFLEDAVLGKKVEYVFSHPEGKIRLKLFYRLPRVYLRIGARFINEELVKGGYAFADYHPSYPENKEFRKLEEYAKRNTLGLWNSCIAECRAKRGCRTLVFPKSSIL